MKFGDCDYGYYAQAIAQGGVCLGPFTVLAGYRALVRFPYSLSRKKRVGSSHTAIVICPSRRSSWRVGSKQLTKGTSPICCRIFCSCVCQVLQNFFGSAKPFLSLCSRRSRPSQSLPNRRGAELARAHGFCAAQQTLAGEHRSGIRSSFQTGGAGGNTNRSCW
jgi:hypothetical protein